MWGEKRRLTEGVDRQENVAERGWAEGQRLGILRKRVSQR